MSLMDASKLEKCLRTVFALDSATDLETLAYHVTPGWDSVGHMALIAELEKEFDCMFEMEDILQMDSYQNVISALKKYV